MLIWAAIWTLAGIAGATMLAIVALLTWWSYDAGVLWLLLLFLGLMATLLILSSRKKDQDDEDDDGEELTDMESFELEFRR
jgi:membrane protein DedA with SNARE-associated domain